MVPTTTATVTAPTRCERSKRKRRTNLIQLSFCSGMAALLLRLLLLLRLGQRHRGGPALAARRGGCRGHLELALALLQGGLGGLRQGDRKRPHLAGGDRVTHRAHAYRLVLALRRVGELERARAGPAGAPRRVPRGALGRDGRVRSDLERGGLRRLRLLRVRVDPAVLR